MTNLSLRQLHQDRAFLHALIGAYQHMLWESSHVEGGAEPSVIITYTGTGEGTPRYLSRALRIWNENRVAGWEPVAYVSEDGLIEKVPASVAPLTGTDENLGKGVSPADHTGATK